MDNEIQLGYQGQILTLNPVGGGIKKYFIKKDGRKTNLIYGYERDKEKAGSMGDILFPWPGRVENCRYNFGGTSYILSGARVKDGHANHGFVKAVPWQIVDRSENSAGLRFILTKAEYGPKGFPFDLSITVSYKLDDSGLTCVTEVLNNGDTPAPFGLGFHPYYAPGFSKVEDMSLQIAAKKLVEFDTGLKPTGRLLKPMGGLDFSRRRKIGRQVIDNCYTDLDFNEGVCKTLLSDGQGTEIAIWQDKNYPYLQVYSADTIGPEHLRKGLALEPQTCTGYAFNLPEMGLIVLKPDEQFKGKWGIQL